MKKILFLVAENGPHTKRFVDELNKELKGIRVMTEEFKDVSLEVAQSKVSIKVAAHFLEDFDLIYFRKAKGDGKNYLSLCATLAFFLDKKGIPYFDSVFGKMGIGTKLLPLVKLALNDIPIVPIYYASRENASSVLPTLVKKFGLPFIAKHTFLQKLKGVYTVRNEADFKKIMKLNFESYIFQKFIDIKEEYRLLVLGNRVEAVHTKVKRSYKNLEVGYQDMQAYGEYVEVGEFSDNFKNIAVKAVRALNLEIAGVDGVIDTNGNFWLFEVNRGPGLYEHTGDYPTVKALAAFFTKELR